jgi:molybdopterin-guanine dinucleotide biosynthesis protein A
MGASKAAVELAGAPLIERPLRSMRAAGLEVVVVAKAATDLPVVDVPVWMEPDEPLHPLTGIVAALEQGGRPLVVCGCDMPFVSP